MNDLLRLFGMNVDFATALFHAQNHFSTSLFPIHSLSIENVDEKQMKICNNRPALTIYIIRTRKQKSTIKQLQNIWNKYV